MWPDGEKVAKLPIPSVCRTPVSKSSMTISASLKFPTENRSRLLPASRGRNCGAKKYLFFSDSCGSINSLGLPPRAGTSYSRLRGPLLKTMEPPSGLQEQPWKAPPPGDSQSVTTEPAPCTAIFLSSPPILTATELLLWSRLRAKQFEGLKFRRQHGVGPYIVDFYCPERRIVIEVDGDTHAEADQVVRDKERDLYLASLGLEVVRYTNGDVVDNLEGVLLDLGKRLALISTSPHPSLQRRGFGEQSLPVLPFVRGGKVG